MPNPGTIRREIPDDFAEMRAKLGGCSRLQVHYSASSRTIQRWLKTSGLPHIQVAPPYRGTPIPDDFRLQAPNMTRSQLMGHYGVTEGVVRRWEKKTGVKPLVARTTGFRFPKLNSDIPPPRRDTPQELAVEYLRRYMPVSRCSERGGFRLDGDHYRVGNTVMTPSAMMERASQMRAKETKKKEYA